MCVEVGRVRVDEAHDRLQTKTKHHNMIFWTPIWKGRECSSSRLGMYISDFGLA